ncbi:hypothetical protein OUZ56_001642 [Daphnia magna]|uniref:Uncharacterized protein n=1 Tax=Daphnia magna TaxID=35525 RepID=A0ABR0A3T7_9CRUS|nr:hypothetical protein OUZ56_001642 [Daphnia magna]
MTGTTRFRRCFQDDKWQLKRIFLIAYMHQSEQIISIKNLVVLFLVYPVGDVWASYTFQAELITRVCSSEFIIVFKKNRIPWIPRVLPSIDI